VISAQSGSQSALGLHQNAGVDATPKPPPEAFAFGENWQQFVQQYLTPDRERLAASALASLFEAEIAGMRFLDIGAGSGLFSLAAYRLGAREVVSVDVDPGSIAACQAVRRRAGSPQNWSVHQGSILDTSFTASIGRADRVYSWGVLHHTGSMWNAIENTVSLVATGGLLGIAIYNRVEGGLGDSGRWWRIKRTYNRVPRAAQVAMEAAYLAAWSATKLAHRENPIRAAREYQSVRGMALRTDVKDWLGGFPYEYATPDEIVSFCTAECGLEVKKVSPAGPRNTGNNEFVFAKS
jgi:2-polyprenyl-3-methyl-5-hydroxy-6-metoxy-1,4-benzoquinol methylase